VIAAVKNLVSKVAGKIAGEPVVAITATVSGGFSWLLSHVSFLPPVTDDTKNTLSLLVATLAGLVARQFVTPNKNLPAGKHAAPAPVIASPAGVDTSIEPGVEK